MKFRVWLWRAWSRWRSDQISGSSVSNVALVSMAIVVCPPSPPPGQYTPAAEGRGARDEGRVKIVTSRPSPLGYHARPCDAPRAWRRRDPRPELPPMSTASTTEAFDLLVV